MCLCQARSWLSIWLDLESPRRPRAHPQEISREIPTEEGELSWMQGAPSCALGLGLNRKKKVSWVLVPLLSAFPSTVMWADCLLPPLARVGQATAPSLLHQDVNWTMGPNKPLLPLRWFSKVFCPYKERINTHIYIAEEEKGRKRR